jgi:hypothetical protein
VASAAAMLLFATVDEVAAPALAQQAMADVAYVEDVSGRVVAFAQGKPILLNASRSQPSRGCSRRFHIFPRGTA